MGRLGILGACAMLVALSGTARAAEITHVATAAEPNKAVDVDLSIRWDRTQERVRITRERQDPTAAPPVGAVTDLTALRYTEIRNAIVPRVAVGLYNDLELHVEWPYVLSDDPTWRLGLIEGQTSAQKGVLDNAVDPSGFPCLTCTLFPFDPAVTVHHGGRMGDVKVGTTWGIFSDRRDDTKPFWLVGLDVTFPSAQLYDPAAGRDATTWLSPYTNPAKRAPVGEKAWRWDLYTALSKRMGPIDPYLRAHVTAMRKSSATYSNCDHAGEFAGTEFAVWSPANCAAWGDRAGARLPFLTGLTFGTEIVPYEDAKEGQKVTLDLRLTADYTSSARWYNELSDATGKILHTDPYVTVGALIGLYLRASDVVSLRARASLETQTPHFLTGESPGGSLPPDPATYQANPAAYASLNPNYDARYDAPGTRFRATETSIFTLSVMGVLQF